MTPENISPPPSDERLTEYDERTRELGIRLDEGIERLIQNGKDLLEGGMQPYSLLETFTPFLDGLEARTSECIGKLATEFGKDSVTLFRLRLRAATAVEEVIWRVMEASRDNDEAKSLMLWSQRQLYGHYVSGIDQILTTNDVHITGSDRKGALQEATVLALLSKDPHAAAAIFVSGPKDDKAHIDLKLFYLQNDRSLVQNIQVKTKVIPREQEINYAHTVLVTGFDTGNLERSEDNRVISSWRTAYAMWRQVNAAKSEKQDEKDNSYIRELLKYNSNKTIIGYLNELGKR